MIFVMLIFVIALILFVWSFLLSINFASWDMYSLIWNFFQSEIVNERNFLLTSWYARYYNTNSWDNNFSCYSNTWVYQDDDCLFRSLYWFLPPNKKIDIWVFNKEQWKKIILDFTGWNFSWVDFLINEVSWTKKYYTKIWNKHFEYDNLKDWSTYNIKLTNLSNERIQYFLYLTWGEGIKEFKVSQNWTAVIGAKYNYVFWKTKLFDKNIDYNLWITLDVSSLFSQVLNFIDLSPLNENKINKIHFNAWWNNSDGFLISTDFRPLSSPQIISLQGWTVTKSCQKQLWWFYRNAGRTSTVYPLDDITLNNLKVNNLYTGLTLTGWFYTFCSWDLQSVYWQVDYFASWWISIYSIQAWRDYNFTWNSILTWSDLIKSLQFFEYKWYYIFNWFVFDSDFWLGYVGWNVADTVLMKKIVNQISLWSQPNDLIKSVTDKVFYFVDSLGWTAQRYYKNLKY